MQLLKVGFVISFLFIAINADIYDEVKNARNFTGKVVLITGSSSGIGEGTAKLFSSLGASVVITGRNQTNIKRIAEETQKLSPYGLKPLEVVADLTKDEDCVRLVNETIAQFGQLDVLVNNAGTGSLSFISDSNILTQFDSTLRIDLRAPLYMSHLSVPYLEKSKGTIINISSLAGLVPRWGNLHYNLAKAALEMLTKVLAVELGSRGIRVNTINPGYTETALATSNELFTEFMRQKRIDLIPLQRAGLPIDLAKAIVFLASSDAQYITGTNVVVDGGSIYNVPANFYETIFNSLNNNTVG